MVLEVWEHGTRICLVSTEGFMLHHIVAEKQKGGVAGMWGRSTCMSDTKGEMPDSLYNNSLSENKSSLSRKTLSIHGDCAVPP
jgi:hypothetical protein